MNKLNAVKLQYYNLPHLSMLLIAPIIITAMYFILRNKSEKVKTIVLFCFAMLNAVMYASYKIVMSQTFDNFVLLSELPLHLCNLNLIIIPVAILTKNKLLMSYLYYVGLLAAFCGIMFFDTVFLGKEVFTYVVMVYFIYHAILMSFPILFILLKMYEPDFSYIWKALLMLVTLATIMLCVNLTLRISGLCPTANYFYTMGMPGNPVLGTLMKIIPVPLLYYLPIIPVLYVFDLGIAYPFVSYKKHHEENYEIIG